jgi:hypothetical protein
MPRALFCLPSLIFTILCVLRYLLCSPKRPQPLLLFFLLLRVPLAPCCLFSPILGAGFLKASRSILNEESFASSERAGYFLPFSMTCPVAPGGEVVCYCIFVYFPIFSSVTQSIIIRQTHTQSERDRERGTFTVHKEGCAFLICGRECKRRPSLLNVVNLDGGISSQTSKFPAANSPSENRRLLPQESACTVPGCRTSLASKSFALGRSDPPCL